MKRREFLKKSIVTSVGVFGMPTIISSSVFAKYRPNDKINIAQIGCGRIAMHHDLPETIRHYDLCRVVAVADVDIDRARNGKRWVQNRYPKKTGKDDHVDVKVYQDYREMLENKSIDAVIISTPDHWHAQPVVEAAFAGKDMYVQKPASLTIAEGRQMSDAVHRTGSIFQMGSQQRSQDPWPQFRFVCELVRNGKIGNIKHIQVGLSTDPGCGEEGEMPVPKNLDYDMWLGSTPNVYYTEKRVHPEKGYGRPGWLRCEQFGSGMITGWGAHHIDIAHWGMGAEYTGPVEIEGTAEFPKSGLWDVHGDFDVRAKYANGVTMNISNKFKNGVRIEGDEGWIFGSRSKEKFNAGDLAIYDPNNRSLQVSDPKILKAQIGPNGVLLYKSPEQHLNWLECIKSRKLSVAPAEVAHRSCSVCLLGHIAMKLPRKLYWNPNTERFVGDGEADKMLSRPQRAGYGTSNVKMAL